MFFGSVQKISWLDNQSKFRCLHYLPAAILEDLSGPPIWRLHAKLYSFARNISPNISTLGPPANLKPGDLSFLFIAYNITISWVYPLYGFLENSPKKARALIG